MFFIWGCESGGLTRQEFESELFLRLAQTITIHDYHLQGESLSKAPDGQWLNLLRFRSWVNDDFEAVDFCLLYRKSKKKVPGALRIVEINRDGVCENYIFDNSALTLDHIRSFSYQLSRDKSRTFHMDLKFFYKPKDEIRGIEKEIRIPFYNLELNSLNKKTKMRNFSQRKFSTSIPISKQTGVKVISKNIVAGKGKWETRLKYDNQVICHDVNEDCETTLDYRCDECPGAWFEVRGNGCITQGRKYCGDAECGGKGQRACFMGYDLDYKPDSAQLKCNQSPFLLKCHENLILNCVEDQFICL